ncbi:MAG: hypothetical protein HY816_08915 [Candidatus Wallbacteria bacterium]|nr:hypothetical protein [Candidatus Wallbacteria bacterium]
MKMFDHEKLDVYAASMECAATLHVCHRLGLLEHVLHPIGREVLLRIVAMLVQMARELAESGTGTGMSLGTGTGTGLGTGTGMGSGTGMGLGTG